MQIVKGSSQKDNQQEVFSSGQDEAQLQSGALTRRKALVGAGSLGAGVALLSACGSSHQEETLTDNDGRPSEPTDMAAASDVPVGGVIQASAKGNVVMISQPTQGVFHAFSSVCTHQGCQLKALKNKSISCPCHSSVFSLEDGSVVGGPAEKPIAEFPLTVKEGRIWVG